jgi:hypothetical protein
MTLTVDTRRAFRTPDELAGLVKAVAEAPAGTDETNWVEFKTGLDLEKPHGKFTAARAILAFANRSPKVAAHACEGVAYVIVGAEPQNVTGVVRIDHASLSQKLSTSGRGSSARPARSRSGGRTGAKSPSGGRPQVRDRHLKFHEDRDNLAPPPRQLV